MGDAVSYAHEFASDEHFAVALGDSIIMSRDGTSLLRDMMAARSSPCPFTRRR